MKRMFPIVVLIAALVMLLSCSNGKVIGPPAIANISGSWEFLVTLNTNNASLTGIEVALKEGQVLIDGVVQPNGQLSASGTNQIAFITLDPSTLDITAFSGNCPPNGSSPVNDLIGSVSSFGGPLSFSYHEAGNLFNVNATLSGDGQSMTGTITAQAGSNCSGGTITGTVVPKLSGTYTGQLCQPLDNSCLGTNDSATATLSQSGTTLTLSLLLTGADNTSFTMTGPVNGRAFSAQGTFLGQSVSYYGYYELTFDSLTQAYDIPSVYLVNTACNPSTQTCGNVLTVPQT